MSPSFALHSLMKFWLRPVFFEISLNVSIAFVMLVSKRRGLRGCLVMHTVQIRFLHCQGDKILIKLNEYK